MCVCVCVCVCVYLCVRVFIYICLKTRPTLDYLGHPTQNILDKRHL